MGLPPRRRVFLALWLFAISAIAVSLLWSFRLASQREAPAGDPFANRPGGMPTPPPFEMELADEVPGLKEPTARPAAEAHLRNDEPVVGVTAGGRARAYVLKAMSHDPHYHVINDILGGVTVSVTHCDVYHCTRVFTGGKKCGPLKLGVGGVKQGGLILRAAGHSYRQDTAAPLSLDDPPFPYDAREETLQTWGEWRQAHPDTDVYLGPEDAEPEPAPPPPPDAEPGPVSPDPPPAWVASVLDVGAAPAGIACAALLLHVLLARLLGPARPRRESQPQLPQVRE
jgi:hypothetical protein